MKSFFWNQDGDFDDPGEELVRRVGLGSHSFSILTPAGFVGSARLRIRTGYGLSRLVPCGQDSYLGEVEDYLVTVTTAAPAPVSPIYCMGGADYDYNYITQLDLGSASYSSARSASGYSDSTSSPISVQAGQTTSGTVTLNVDYWPENGVGVWVDWNGDGDFADPQEEIYRQTGLGAHSFSLTPPSSFVGTARLRVRMGYGLSSLVSCGQDSYMGEVEDYTLDVQPAP